MIDERLLCEMYHSIAIYCMAAGAPHLVKLPDLIQSILDGNKELANEDAGILTVECIVSLIESYIDTMANKDWCDGIKKQIPPIRLGQDKIAAKAMALRLLNEVLVKMGHKEVAGL